MPEYHMDIGERRAEFRALDAFTQAYIEAMFWTSNAPSISTEEWQAAEFEPFEGSIPGDVGFSDLAPEALTEIIADCTAFQSANEELLESAYANGRYGPDQAGVDYWLTRNGHGAGFWDRGLGKIGDDLSAMCRQQGVNVYLGDDGKVYIQ